MTRYRHNSTFKVNRVPGTSRIASGKGKVNRICQHCGKEFRVWRGYVGKACSRVCADKLRRTKVKRTCRQCGTEFLFAPSQLKKYKGGGRFCSKPCASKWHIAMSADRPSTDRYNRTGRHADKEWQKAVRDRDSYTCQRCGIYDRYVHAHHVASRSRRPDLKHDVSNGKCLCGSCHQYVHHHPKEAALMGLLSDASYERAQKEKRLCLVCGAKHFGLNFCLKHYKRFKKYGDPLLTKPKGAPGHTSEPIRVSEAA